MLQPTTLQRQLPQRQAEAQGATRTRTRTRSYHGNPQHLSQSSHNRQRYISEKSHSTSKTRLGQPGNGTVSLPIRLSS